MAPVPAVTRFQVARKQFRHLTLLKKLVIIFNTLTQKLQCKIDRRLRNTAESSSMFCNCQSLRANLLFMMVLSLIKG